MLFHKYEGANFAVENFMSRFSMLIPTKANVKLDNGNIGYTQVIGIILCRFPNCYIIYPTGSVYYFTVQPSNTISLGALLFYIGFQNVTYELLEHCDFVESQGNSWRSTYQTQNNLDYLQI